MLKKIIIPDKRRRLVSLLEDANDLHRYVIWLSFVSIHARKALKELGPRNQQDLSVLYSQREYEEFCGDFFGFQTPILDVVNECGRSRTM